MRRRYHATAFVAFTTFASLASVATAASYSIDLNSGGLFGTLDQDDVKIGPDDPKTGINSCAPTATMNSFTYLQNAFPHIYGTNDELMGGHATWLDAAIDLAENYMNTQSDTGTTDDGWITGKYDWLEQYAPGKTRYAGMNEFTTGGMSWVQQAIPDIGFILKWLQQGANIEIGISPSVAGQIGHVLTISSIHWEDTDNDLQFDTGEGLSLDGIDPATGSAFDFDMKWVDHNGTSYLGFADGQGYDGYRIDAALAEAPVPLPTAALSGLVLLMALALHRTRPLAA